MLLERKFKNLKQWLKPLKAVDSIISILKGAFAYSKTGVTPERAYYSLIDLYCLTNGYSNAFLAWLLKLYRHPYILPHANGVLGDLDSVEINRIVKEIRKDGYYIFDKLLAVDVCNKLMSLALTKECSLGGASDSTLQLSIYNRENPVAVTYHLQEEDLIANPDIQMLMGDLSILAIAQAYLETQPILDIVALWWSTTFSKTACSKSAQLYHFDMDRIKWLKFFVYLTDITIDNGPHCYIAGSHQLGNKPKELLKLGYARIPDKDIEKFYPKENFVEITAPKGTIIAGDTLCFHKGKPLKKGDRLILQLEFTNSLFGGSYSKSILSKSHNSVISRMFTDYPRLYLKFSQES
jgi:Phytanoyl-CoA dioxygenase (PhyH)